MIALLCLLSFSYATFVESPLIDYLDATSSNISPFSFSQNGTNWVVSGNNLGLFSYGNGTYELVASFYGDAASSGANARIPLSTAAAASSWTSDQAQSVTNNVSNSTSYLLSLYNQFNSGSGTSTYNLIKGLYDHSTDLVNTFIFPSGPYLSSNGYGINGASIPAWQYITQGFLGLSSNVKTVNTSVSTGFSGLSTDIQNVNETLVDFSSNFVSQSNSLFSLTGSYLNSSGASVSGSNLSPSVYLSQGLLGIAGDLMGSTGSVTGTLYSSGRKAVVSNVYSNLADLLTTSFSHISVNQVLTSGSYLSSNGYSSVVSSYLNSPLVQSNGFLGLRSVLFGSSDISGDFTLIGSGTSSANFSNLGQLLSSFLTDSTFNQNVIGNYLLGSNGSVTGNFTLIGSGTSSATFFNLGQLLLSFLTDSTFNQNVIGNYLIGSTGTVTGNLYSSGRKAVASYVYSSLADLLSNSFSHLSVNQVLTSGSYLSSNGYETAVSSYLNSPLVEANGFLGLRSVLFGSSDITSDFTLIGSGTSSDTFSNLSQLLSSFMTYSTFNQNAIGDYLMGSTGTVKGYLYSAGRKAAVFYDYSNLADLLTTSFSHMSVNQVLTSGSYLSSNGYEATVSSYLNSPLVETNGFLGLRSVLFGSSDIIGDFTLIGSETSSETFSNIGQLLSSFLTDSTFNQNVIGNYLMGSTGTVNGYLYSAGRKEAAFYDYSSLANLLTNSFSHLSVNQVLTSGSYLSSNGYASSVSSYLNSPLVDANGFNGLATILRGQSGSVINSTLWNYDENYIRSDSVVQFTNVLQALASIQSSLQQPLRQLQQIYASDDDLKLRQDTIPQLDAVEEDFFTDGKAAPSVSNIGDIGSVSSDMTSLLDSGVSVSDFFTSVNTSDSYSFFSQATADDLDSVNFVSALSMEDPFEGLELDEDGFYQLVDVSYFSLWQFLGKEG